MTDDEPIPSLAEALTELRAKFGDDALEVLRLRAADLTAFEEIRRLRARIVELEADNEGLDDIIIDQAKVIDRLRARIAELEGNAAITFGTLEQPTPDEPAVITHGHPPSAPPHNE